MTREGLEFWRHVQTHYFSITHIIPWLYKRVITTLSLREDAMHQLIEDGYDWELVYQTNQKVSHSLRWGKRLLLDTRTNIVGLFVQVEIVI